MLKCLSIRGSLNCPLFQVKPPADVTELKGINCAYVTAMASALNSAKNVEIKAKQNLAVRFTIQNPTQFRRGVIDQFV